MKTRLFLLAAVATIGFTACQNNNSDGGYTQEQLDSIVQYKADSAANALKMANDSTINAIADSVAQAELANTGTKTTGNKKGSTPTKKNPTVAPAEKAPVVRTPAEMEADKKAARFGDAEAKARVERDEATKKAARFGDADAQQKVDQTEAQKKADRFNK